MAGSLNKVTIIGNVGKDPEIRTFQNGNKVASFSIATSEKWTDKQSGEKKEKTEWHRISVFGDGLIGVLEKYVKKGSKLYVEGQLETRKWQDKEGKDCYSTEVVLRPYNGSVILLGDPGGASRGAPARESDERSGYGGYDDRATAPAKGKSAGDRLGGGGGSYGKGGFADLNDEIPFQPQVD